MQKWSYDVIDIFFPHIPDYVNKNNFYKNISEKIIRELHFQYKRKMLKKKIINLQDIFSDLTNRDYDPYNSFNVEIPEEILVNLE